jgi:hypothetical protein
MSSSQIPIRSFETANNERSPISIASSGPHPAVAFDKPAGATIVGDRPVLDTREVYTSGGLLSQAIRILTSLEARIDYARESVGSSNPAESDLAVMGATDELKRLFTVRSISPTFGMVVTAVGSAFTSRAVFGFEETQLEALRYVVSSLRSDPLMRDERALGLIDKLEEAGLDVLSKDYNQFLGLIDGD